MKTYTQEELRVMLAGHQKWLVGGDGSHADLSDANLCGANLSDADLSDVNLCDANLRRANLCGANLRHANLSDANLCGANLRHADLSDANLCDANLRRANLCRANLCDANLRRANLRGADLSDANLCGANLRHANLSDANLCGADLSDVDLPGFNIPQEGSLVVWKACRNGLVKLCVEDGVRRTASLIGRKCRAERALVLETPNGEPTTSKHDSNFVYEQGKVVTPDAYDDDPRVECSNGIHFFLTKEEAERWL